jgi:acetylornithine deacetylase/succinyl-diaminopimelate desuccinylase-like protein
MPVPPTPDKDPLSGYPGYFSGKLPIWRRKWVAATAAGLFGFVVGAGASGGETTSTVPAGYVSESVVEDRVADEVEEVSESTDARVDEAVAEAVRSVRADARSLVEQVRADAQRLQKRAVATAVRRAVTKERSKADAKIEAARESAQSLVSNPAPDANTSGGDTDPQYTYCYEANAGGYGPYQEGVDPEYDWYDDRDGDGVVCEY